MTIFLFFAIVVLTGLFFGETMPKIIAKRNANRPVTILCYPIRVLSLMLKPVTIVVVGLVNLIMKALPKPRIRHGEDEAQQELQSIIETAEDENVFTSAGLRGKRGSDCGQPVAEPALPVSGVGGMHGHPPAADKACLPV